MFINSITIIIDTVVAVAVAIVVGDILKAETWKKCYRASIRLYSFGFCIRSIS